jgi:urease accessory protein
VNSIAINNKTINRTQDAPWHWQAHLQLRLGHSLRGSMLNRCRHNGPLYVQKPFYPEGKDCAHVYLLHPPGGLVSGDTLKIDIELEKNAHSVMTTPGAARMYRARIDSPIQRQDIHISVADNAIMEWFPMETIVYNAAAAELSTTVELTNNSHLMAWEITCLGLPASQQLMKQGYFQQQYKILHDGLPVFVDRLRYDANNQQLFTNMAGMQSQTVSGFFIAGRSHTTEVQAELLETIRAKFVLQRLEKLFSITWVNGFCITRYLGCSANQAREGFILVWETLRPALLNKKACHPRIWLT